MELNWNRVCLSGRMDWEKDGSMEGEEKRKDGWFTIPLVVQLTKKGKSQSIQIESIENYKQMKA